MYDKIQYKLKKKKWSGLGDLIQPHDFTDEKTNT